MSTKLTLGLFITMATAALAIDDCIFINFGDEDDEDREQRDQDVPPHLRAAAAAA
jgi:hypothetical protein